MSTICRRLAPEETPPRDMALNPLSLPFEIRRRSRQRWTLPDRHELAWVLPPGQMLEVGDHLLAADGQLYQVQAANEQVLRVHSHNPRQLAQAAYHLGNRHVMVEIGADYLALMPDSVLRDMLQRLGLQVTSIHAPFAPETGAYGGGHKHGHDSSFAEDYQLAQAVYLQREPK